MRYVTWLVPVLVLLAVACLGADSLHRAYLRARGVRLAQAATTAKAESPAMPRTVFVRECCCMRQRCRDRYGGGRGR
jgi:hypothetical protein